MSGALVVAEHRHGKLRSVTQEAVQAAAELTEEPITLVLIAPDPDGLTDALAFEAVETIETVTLDEPFNHDVYRQVVAQLAVEHAVDLLVAGNTVNAHDYLPAVAAGIEWPLVTDVIAAERTGAGLTVRREGYGSKVELTLAIEELPAVLAIRPGSWPAAPAGDVPTVRAAPVTVDEAAIRSVVEGIDAVERGEVDLGAAEVIVAVGRGIGEAEHIALIEDLADVIGATVAASRPIVDAGWLPRDRQVGQSGATVAPSVYIAIGISGAVQHVAGMRGAETIVAINDDPDAPIFEIADVGVVGDLFEVVPALIDRLAE